MFEVNDRVVLSEECIEHTNNTFGEERLKEWGVDIRGFGEGTIVGIRDVEHTWPDPASAKFAVIEWDNPQTLTYEDSHHDKLLNQVNFGWLEKVA